MMQTVNRCCLSRSVLPALPLTKSMHRFLMLTQRLPLAASLLLALVTSLAAEDPFQSNVRPTEPLTPQQELASFQVPPGFEVQLVAAEPDIQKPMNLAFDERGRLWITESIEYPYAAPLDRPGRDNIKILEDTNGDGRADKITTFADGLNIPIGIVPYRSGAIAYSIPYIWHLRDTDGDGRADEREKLFGPMGYERDTHGMNNAFRRGFDDWIYACHGFNNETVVRGRDGHEVRMQSGNTYRIRADGSRIEQFTWGQVNPFGMTIDPMGNLFTADCHSKPIYQLLRGGYYPSFGKPHDGLGFVPPMMDHLHGSTAIAGVAWYGGRNFPAAYRGNLLSGNVMTSRVNRNRLEYHGSTIVAREEHDLVWTSDPWFRPVDVQVGPDGALYVADFYNRVIGHYEVPLDHPGRDRHRGRIWRVVYKGDDPASETAVMPAPISDLPPDRQIAQLGDPNLTRRLLATNYLVDTADEATLDALLKTVQAADRGPLLAHGLWVLHRRERLPASELLRAAVNKDRVVATHAMKILADTGEWTTAQRSLALAGLGSPDVFVRRAAADALGLHADPANLAPLLELLDRIPEADVLLRYTVRLALRDNLRQPDVFKSDAFQALLEQPLNDARRNELAALCLALPTEPAGAFLVRHLQESDEPREKVVEYVRHAARYTPAAQAAELAAWVRRKFVDDRDFQQQLLISLVEGLEQRGGQLNSELADWAKKLAGGLLATIQQDSKSWTNMPIPGSNPADNPWVLQVRTSADGDDKSVFFCSLPHGERLTGTLRSPDFAIPESLSFFTAGHLGFPDQPLDPRNFIRLRDARTHELLVEARPPRNDTAQAVHWDLSQSQGRMGYLELVDGDDRAAYAWLAVGRFDPPVVPLPDVGPRQLTERIQAAAQLVGKFKLAEFEPQLAQLLGSARLEPAACEAVAEAILRLRPDSLLAAVRPLLGDANVPEALRAKVLQAIVQPDPLQTSQALAEAMRQASGRWQQLLAQALAGDKANSEFLLKLVEQGHASPRLLRESTVVARLKSLHGEQITERLDRLTAGVPPENEERDQLIQQRRQALAKARTSPEQGARLFGQHCAACHQLAGKGPLIGPQLDGIGNRGADRLLEDILDPNRNVDVAFNVTSLALADGKVVSGLMRREAGAQWVLVDNLGKEFTVNKDDVEEQAKVRLSLMPEDLARRMSEQEFYDLLAFLLEQRAGKLETP